MHKTRPSRTPTSFAVILFFSLNRIPFKQFNLHSFSFIRIHSVCQNKAKKRQVMMRLTMVSFLSVLWMLMHISIVVDTQMASNYNNHFVDWATLKSVLNRKTDVDLFLLVRSDNSQFNGHSTDMIVKEFIFSKTIFHHFVKKSIPDMKGERFGFFVVEPSKKMIGFLKEKLPMQKVSNWAKQYPAMIVHIDPSGQVHMMDNFDRLSHYYILCWLERRLQVSIVGYVKRLNQYSEFVVNTMNLVLLLACLASLVLGVYKDDFFIKRLSTISVILFPSGHIWNQLHGVEDNIPHNTLFGISFTKQSNSQNISEGLFIFFLLGLFTTSMYYHSISQKMLIKEQLKMVNPTRGPVSRQSKHRQKLSIWKKDPNLLRMFQMTAFTISCVLFLYVFKMKR